MIYYKLYMSILDRFRVTESNTPLKKAKVIGIAEKDHYSPDVALEGQLVNSLARRGDSVLLEAYQAGVKLSRKNPDVKGFGLRRGVKISGWENMEQYHLGI